MEIHPPSVKCLFVILPPYLLVSQHFRDPGQSISCILIPNEFGIFVVIVEHHDSSLRRLFDCVQEDIGQVLGQADFYLGPHEFISCHFAQDFRGAFPRGLVLGAAEMIQETDGSI